MTNQLMRELRDCKNRKKLINHSFFSRASVEKAICREDVEMVLGQWWWPLHYFPVFLSRSISVLEDIRHQSFIADILNEELGEGDPEMAHERIYVDTMLEVGFSVECLTQSQPLPATQALVSNYEAASFGRLDAMGCVFATEVADLAMVGGIGKIVRRVTGASKLPWVDIHLQQEPNHVSKVQQTMGNDLSAPDRKVVVSAADAHWQAWCEFFDALEYKIAVGGVLSTGR